MLIAHGGVCTPTACQREGVGAYLESSTERNRMLYRRFGFDVIEELNWPGGGPPFWRMWRPAP